MKEFGFKIETFGDLFRASFAKKHFCFAMANVAA